MILSGVGTEGALVSYDNDLNLCWSSDGFTQRASAALTAVMSIESAVAQVTIPSGRSSTAFKP